MNLTTPQPMRSAHRRVARAAGAALLLALAPMAQANDVVALKNALYGAGYDVPNVSPDMGDATRKALVQFQKDHGLEASGVLNEDTKKALGLVTVAAATQAAPKASAAKPSTKAEPAAKAQAAKAPEPKPAKDDGAIEEDDDGGWSLW
ncbi:peptidoglycan-binding domain-containing protein [Marinobacter sp. C2H3]|uniref:peptidoglycan-binding domain-containing protein n=1 Tax=Marinobacter sp. C2H3 TaxID=3119003 RepID=UPI00300E91A6